MKVAVLAFAIIGMTGCATYRYARDVKMVSFDDDCTKGKSVGPIRGEDCTWTVLGYEFGKPTLDKAVDNAKTANQVRYVNHLSTENDGFNVGFLKKDCIVIKGGGYK